jgi:hypothetical protein
VRRPFRIQIGTLVLLACVASPLRAENMAPVATPAAFFRIKVVVRAMFEGGEDTGDTPGHTNHGSNGSICTKFCRPPLGITLCIGTKTEFWGCSQGSRRRRRLHP